jgi:hypothetical protein
MWVKIVIKLSDGLIKLLQNYTGKPITAVVKKAHHNL